MKCRTAVSLISWASTRFVLAQQSRPPGNLAHSLTCLACRLAGRQGWQPGREHEQQLPRGQLHCGWSFCRRF